MKFSVALVLVLNFYLASGGLFYGASDGPEQIKKKVRVSFSPDSIRVVEFPLGQFPTLFFDKDFNASRPMVIYFHGWLSNVKDSSVLAMRSSYAGYNVVTVDWSVYAVDYRFFSKVIPTLKIIAETTAELLYQFLENGYDVTKLHLAGHSLGGQTVGKISRHLREITHGKHIIPLIVALDPAGPGFEQNTYDGFETVSSTDAKFVVVIHSSTILGMDPQIGTIDFFPNGGVTQPGCSRFLLFDDEVCNHLRGWQLYQAALRNPTGFPAVRCASYDDFLRMNRGGNCYRNEVVYMGLTANRNATGKYYLQTTGNMFKFSKGMSGTSPSSKVFLRKLKTQQDFENEVYRGAY